MDRDIPIGERVSAEYAKPVHADTELVRMLKAGEKSAWADFHHRFFRWTYRFAYYHLGRSHSDAEDLSSEILLAAVRNIDRFDATKGDLDAWLLGIAKHSLGHYCRRRRREIPMIPEMIAAQMDVDAPTETALNDRSAVHDAVNRALASLPARQSAVLVEKYVEGYTLDEIARIGATTPKAIESLLGRARSSFKVAFTRFLGIPERGRRA